MANKSNKAEEPEYDNIMKFTDEAGNIVTFEILDCIEYEGKDYAVLLPEEGSEYDNGMVYIFEVAEELDSDTDTYLGVEDEAIIEAVYGKFMEAHKDDFNFED